MEIKKIRRMRGEVNVPGDKSISHRAVMLGALAEGITAVTDFLEGADCLSTIDCFRKLGICIEKSRGELLIHGRGLHGLKASDQVLNVGNSGTTTRLMSGILAGQPFVSKMDGDASLRSRPMKRIIDPLTQMGARIYGEAEENRLPLVVEGGNLKGINYDSPVASAQVKSCVLLAGLYADAPTSVSEPVLSRDHTERMLRNFGAEVISRDRTATVFPEPSLRGIRIQVPGDISSAAYFLAAGLISQDAEILLKNVGINPTRDGMLRVLKKMGADITLQDMRTDGEPCADLLVKSSALKGTVIEGDIIPSLIDELPMIAVLAAFAEGTTIIKDAGELRVKESDRIETVTRGLQTMGADVQATGDGMIIHGGRPLHGGSVRTELDHRIAMSFAVAGTVCEGTVTLEGGECVDISYPAFYRDLYSLADRS